MTKRRLVAEDVVFQPNFDLKRLIRRSYALFFKIDGSLNKEQPDAAKLKELESYGYDIAQLLVELEPWSKTSNY